MGYLVAGLLIFLGVHSVRIFADGWRTHTLQRLGEGAYKGLYSLLALLGFGLIVYGFGVARETPVMLWTPPMGMRHAASLFTVIAFVLLFGASLVVPEKPRLGFSLGVPCMVFIETEPLVWMGLHQAAAGAITTQAR